MHESNEFFERNTEIWLNYKFSPATIKEIAEAFGISSERVRRISFRRDREVKSTLTQMGYHPFEEIPPGRRKILDTLYGIRISHQPGEYYSYEIHLTLEDPEKIAALLTSKVNRRSNVRNEKGSWVSQPANR